MIYKILQNGEEINTIVADQTFVETYCTENGYTYQEVQRNPSKNSPKYTDIELAQQEITDRELDSIEQGQAMTSLELITIEQNQILNVLTGSDTNDNL